MLTPACSARRPVRDLREQDQVYTIDLA